MNDRPALIKNKHGKISQISDERKKFLLDPHPILMKANGKPKLDPEGDPIFAVKGEYEKGYVDVTPAEEKAYWAEMEARKEQRDEEDEAQEIANAAANAAIQASVRAAKAGTGKGKSGRKSNAQKEAEEAEAKKVEEEKKAAMEVTVRAAEGDKAKYDALSDEEKKMYADLELEVPAAK